ncbi:alpha/beta hydrolase family protein [Leptospira ryugenii]|uniref:Alpha/beta hydrolase family protein n=1 Tax=Leptospira ryugenii TaxID=1917863 RepID=A0A2P2DXS7_9LEPT|nr:alpha/beta hydrolase family protein [Leptospira ryugenii]
MGEFKWVYLEGGEGKETILTIHGFGGDKDHWTRFVRTLSDDYRIISPDLPGFGENDRLPNQSYDIKHQVERLHEFVKSLGLKSFHIVGNSMGGAIAGYYAATYPEDVLSLTLINTAGVKSPVPSELANLLQAGKPNPLLVGSVEDFDRLLAFSFVKPPYIPGPLKTYFTNRAIQNRDWNEGIFTQIRKDPFLLESVLNKIKAPTCIIWGKEDRIIHVSSTEVLVKKIKSKQQLIILPEMGHAPMIESPREVAEHWLKWQSNIAHSSP